MAVLLLPPSHLLASRPTSCAHPRIVLFAVKRGDRVAQLILERIATPEVCLLACLPACLLACLLVC